MKETREEIIKAVEDAYLMGAEQMVKLVRSNKYLNIERIISLMEAYVSIIKELRETAL